MACSVRISNVWLAAAASAVLWSAPASAAGVAIAAGSTRSWAKNDAILGGAPSALQAILAQQSGQPVTATPAPASYSIPAMPAVLRSQPKASAGVLSGRPDVFGSVALKIRRAPLMAKWNSVHNARLAGAPARYAQSLSDRGEVERLEAVNRYVNERVQFVDDRKQYGRADVWAAAGETLSRGRGDCEDFAVAKLQMLRRAGFDDRDLYLVIVKDLITRADHAVLVVRAAGQMFVLDNGTSKLLNSEDLRDYRPILSFAASGGAWTHGYRRSATMELASAEEIPAVPVLAAASDQRSRSASLLAFNTGFNK
jgi:predicted transglutaminase-like cysteine proteinase